MKGNPKIGKMLKAANAIVKPFTDIINRLSSNNDRDWVVRVEPGGANEDSYFVASDKQVALVLKQSSFSDSGAGVTGDFDYYDGTTGTLRVAHYINGRLDSTTE